MDIVKNVYGTTAEWAANDIVLNKGELGIEKTVKNEHKIKVGDGTSAWSILPYSGTTDYNDLQNRPTIPSGEADLFYVDLDGKFPTYTCTTPMEDIKSAYNAGRELKCRCAIGDFIAVLPLFVPMPLANTWLFSGSGAISAPGMDFPAQTFTVAIANGNVVAQNTRLAPKNKMLTVNVGNTSYTYDGSQETNITITDATEVSY